MDTNTDTTKHGDTNTLIPYKVELGGYNMTVCVIYVCVCV